jgi:hypothetical protein
MDTCQKRLRDKPGIYQFFITRFLAPYPSALPQLGPSEIGPAVKMNFDPEVWGLIIKIKTVSNISHISPLSIY